MDSFAERISELKEKCTGDFVFTEDDRTLLHNAYWTGGVIVSMMALEMIAYEPGHEDLPILLDASSPSSAVVCRVYAAEALGGLGDQGAGVLRLMMEREKHPLVRF